MSLHELTQGEDIPESDKLIKMKSLNIRIAPYLNVNPRTSSRWVNKRPLVEQEVYVSKSYIFARYLEYQSELMGNYCETDKAYIRGHKLYYVRYGEDEGFTYYINKKCFEYYESGMGDEKVFIDKIVNMGSEEVNPYVLALSAKLGIQLAKWIDRLIRGGVRTYEECKRCLKSYERFTQNEYNGDLRPPSVIYYETRGYVLLDNVYKYLILSQLEYGSIAGTFKYNPMDLEVWRLAYG